MTILSPCGIYYASKTAKNCPFFERRQISNFYHLNCNFCAIPCREDIAVSTSFHSMESMPMRHNVSSKCVAPWILNFAGICLTILCSLRKSKNVVTRPILSAQLRFLQNKQKKILPSFFNQTEIGKKDITQYRNQGRERGRERGRQNEREIE